MARLPSIWEEPFRLTTRLGRWMDEFFRDFESPFLGWESLGRTDIYEDEKGEALVYETELPGVRKEEIDIRVEDNRLIVSGEVKRDERISEENYLRIGRHYGRFQRTFPLPEEIGDPKKIQAKFEHGILKITVPLKESLKKAKVIEIKVE
ncbi:MAG: Hsp20/alpha crystallin family protein [Candidatus Acetothermia bacterium]|jgi:HSP20 family protein|nr:Hsp20/alpha crystallin family protein [Candidatus Acetothermia bacterium]MDH7504706.1 Hsp20/alpha crystallin family protein [Candidatus Acetothermia bacterium]